MIKTVKDVDLKGKRIIMRVDFNVPMKDGVVQDDTRIQAALPTIKYIIEQNPRSLVLMSHLGDPKKDVKKAQEKAEKAGKTWTDADAEKFINGKNRMKPVVEYFAKVLGKDVTFLPDALGQKAAIDALPEGGIAMLENTRFHKEETSKDDAERDSMAKELATYGDIFVNDAFGTAHRDHASTASIAKFMKVNVGGFLMEKEVTASSRRELIPSFSKIVARCRFTVTTEINRCSAICAFVQPAAARRATSISRRESATHVCSAVGSESGSALGAVVPACSPIGPKNPFAVAS